MNKIMLLNNESWKYKAQIIHIGFKVNETERKFDEEKFFQDKAGQKKRGGSD